jgi:hypothetical protein
VLTCEGAGGSGAAIATESTAHLPAEGSPEER